MRSHEEYGIIMKRDCDRYAMKREVAADLPVFPWSMSDFKPGERIFDVMVKDQSALCVNCVLTVITADCICHTQTLLWI